MPIYEYICPQCKKVSEVIVPMNATFSINCGKCGVPMEKKSVYRCDIHFKGSGFYVTDSKGEK